MDFSSTLFIHTEILHQPSLEIMCLLTTNVVGLVLPFLKVSVGRGVPICEGITALSVGACTESASEWSYRINISCTAGPNMYSQGVLACIYHCVTPSSLSFPNWTAPSWTLSTVFWMLASVWSAALLFGELPPGGGVGGGKRLDLEEKKTSLFVEERNSNPWWQTDAGWFFPEVTGSWWSN